MSDQDQKDLDYYITFPSFPAASTTSKDEDDDDDEPRLGGPDQREEFVFVYEDDKRPVVVLLGWAGCQDKYLAKYSAIYEEKRYCFRFLKNFRLFSSNFTFCGEKRVLGQR